MIRVAAGMLLCLFAVETMAEDGLLRPRTPEGWTVPLEQLGYNGALDTLPDPRVWRVKQVSSYDRSGGNADAQGGHQVYDGGVVLADLEGPGVVTRLWTRNPNGNLYIFVDDIESPILTMPFKEFFTGGLEYWSPGFNLMGPPFVGESSGGYYSYLPIPYEERCRIIVTTEEDSLAYQVTYAELPEATPIQSFDLKLTKDDVGYFKRWVDQWEGISLRWPGKNERMHKSRHDYWPHKNTMAYPIVGPGVITEIELKLESADPDILEGAWISIHFDNQETPSVLAPIGAFFGVAMKETEDHNSLVIGRHEGRMWCRFPMPFRERAEIRFINTTDEIADIAYWITWKEQPVDDAYYFFARYNEAVTEEGKPYIVADIEGEGHYVGTTIAAKNADSLTFLEGDDAYLVDGDPGSEFHGTGTDDYFNAGWYFATGPVSAPTHAVTLKKAQAPAGFSAFRSHLVAPVPFKDSFVFELEHGPHNNRPGVNYMSVAYWYQQSPEAKAWEVTRLAEAGLDQR